MHQNSVSSSSAVTNIPGQQFYHQGAATMATYPNSQIFQQNVSQPIFHGYSSSPAGGHIDVVANQSPQVYAAHPNTAGNNAVATSMGYIQPMQTQVANVQNIPTVAPSIPTLQVKKILIFFAIERFSIKYKITFIYSLNIFNLAVINFYSCQYSECVRFDY